MKAAWTNLSQELEQQKQLTHDVILKMTQEKSNSRLGRIMVTEGIGMIACMAGLVFLISKAGKLQEHWSAMVGGIGLFLILILGITFGFRIIKQARSINLLENSYTEVIERFNRFRMLMRSLKKLSIWTNILGVFFVLPVTTQLSLGKNVFEVEGIGIGLLFAAVLVPLVLYLIMRFYASNVSAVKKALNELPKD